MDTHKINIGAKGRRWLVEKQRVIQNLQGSLARLMHKIPMVRVEEFPEAM
jgi:hypothetical protein